MTKCSRVYQRDQPLIYKGMDEVRSGVRNMLRKTNKQNPSSLKPGLEKTDSALPATVSKDWGLEIACPTLCDPMDYTVPGILQVRILEWVAVPFSRGSSQPRDQTQVSCIAGDSLPAEPQGKPKNTGVGSLSLLQWLFPIQESNRGLLYCRQILYQLSYQG